MLEGCFPTTVEWGLFVSCAVCTSVVTLILSFLLIFLRDFLILVLKYQKIPLVLSTPIFFFFNVYNEIQHNLFLRL